MNQSEIHRIRQVIFHVESTRTYKFDVNSNITIKGLKKMICFAANLNKNTVKIFNENKDYTQFDDETLFSLFPDKQKVEFHISIAEQLHQNLNESRIKLRLGDNCEEHTSKYLYFYCYDCGRSICSLCLQGVHESHNVLEKYDYLQSSKHLVDLLFQDVGNFVSDNKRDKGIDAEELKKRVKTIYFPELREMLNSIEKYQIDLIDDYYEVFKKSNLNIKDNINLLKQHCTEGLEKLKEEIHIENLMQNEEVFLTFDKKYREMAAEKNRIKEEQVQYEKLNENFGKIAESIDNIHNRLFHFLDVEMRDGVYNTLRNVVNMNGVQQVQKDEIIEKLLSDVKRPVSGRKSLAYMEKSMLRSNPRLNSPAKEQIDQKINFNAVSSIFNLMTEQYSNYKNKNKEEEELLPSFPSLSSSKPTDNNTNINLLPSVSKEKDKDKEKQATKSETVAYNESLSMHKEKSDNKETSSVTRTQIVQNLENKVEEKFEKYDLQYIIMRCKTGSKDILIYNDLTDDVNSKTVDFPKLSNVSEFLPYCSWINLPGTGKLYISGGWLGDSSSNSFFCYNFVENSLTRLADMNVPRYSHSMVYHNNCIYAVGGYKNNSCEKFDFNSMKWLKLSNLNFEEKQNTMLTVYNGHVYAFFGYGSGNYTESVEKLKISNPKAKWEIVPYKNPTKINLKLIGCATSIKGTNLYFFGGKSKTEQRRTAFEFDFSNSTFNPIPLDLEDVAYFYEGFLYPLSNECWGNFDNEQGDHFFRISINEG